MQSNDQAAFNTVRDHAIKWVYLGKDEDEDEGTERDTSLSVPDTPLSTENTPLPEEYQPLPENPQSRPEPETEQQAEGMRTRAQARAGG
jgi:hypothetical protein